MIQHRPTSVAKTRSQNQAHTQALNLVKDALGAFAIMTMLYVGLFIPAI